MIPLNIPLEQVHRYLRVLLPINLHTQQMRYCTRTCTLLIWQHFPIVNGSPAEIIEQQSLDILQNLEDTLQNLSAKKLKSSLC